MKKLLLFFTLTLLLLVKEESFAQTIVSCPYYKMVTFDSSPFKSFKLTGGNVNPWYDMTFRLLFPKNYDSSLVTTTNYPMVVMLHGAGESALGNNQFGNYPEGDPRRFNNDNHLKHQGSQYITAVNNGKWPGFVLFPQNPNGFWTGQNWFLDEAIEIIQTLITTLKIDPNRIYISGLSAGSHGAWEGLSRYNSLFAAANIMSGIGYPTPENTTKVAHIPLWYFQGEIDGSPSKYTADGTIEALRNVGGTPIYTVYPNTSHDTWNKAIAEPNYFNFLLGKSKLTIHPYFGKTEYCLGESISTRLAISPGFTGYEWQKDNVTISGATSNEITATQPGNYTVRFRRGTQWTDWSSPITIKYKTPTATPIITADGSTALPGLDGRSSVVLSAPAGNTYKWSNGATTQTITVNTPGSYTVRVTEPGGCISDPSVPVVVTIGNGANVPTAPSNLVVASNAMTSLDLGWNDNSSNETGFEIYRSNSASGPFVFNALIAANSTSFNDPNLNPNTTYYYKVRAINNNGASAAISGNGTTQQDLVSPTIPQNLVFLPSTDSTLVLSWSPSNDNVGVTGYQVYANGSYFATTTNTTDTISITAGQIISFYVRATDYSGNLSAQSNVVNNAAGLKFSYYEGTWDQLPDFSSLTPVKTGYVPNFTLSPAKVTNYFAFKYEGNIYVPVDGTYTFYTSSDDGSKLYIGDSQLVNNDGLHGTIERNASITLTKGSYPITVTFFEKSGGEVLQVKYQGPAGSGIVKQLIPDQVLVDSTTALNLPAAPTTLVATTTPAVYNRINLSWTNNATNQTGFEIFRSSPGNTTYQLIATVGGDQTTYADNGLAGSTKYYYKIRSINNSGSSIFSNEVNKTTGVNPSTPAAPTSPAALALSTSSIRITWTDNSNNETGFEVHRAAVSGGPYSLVYSSGSNTTSFTDINLNAYTTYYYKVLATNSGANSNFTSVVNARTFTNPPVLATIGNKTIAEGSINNYTISGSDPDNDLVHFSISNQPSFVAITDNLNNTATLSVKPLYSHSGVYSNIVVTASDGKGGTSTETITITVTNVNQAPVLASIGNQNVNEGSTLIIDLSGSDPDGDSVSVAITSALPSFATFINNGDGTGSISVTPVAGQAGSYSITAQVTDSNSSSVSETFTLKVNKVNFHQPVLAAIGNKILDENTLQSYIISATDGDEDSLTLSVTGLPGFASFVDHLDGNGTLTIAPDYTHAGEYQNIVFTTSDGNGGTASETISITVNDVNRVPVLTSITNQSLNEGATVTLNISATDPDSDLITLSASNLPSFATFTPNGNGTATLKLSPGFTNAGTYSNVTITATDGKGGSDSKNFNISVVDVPEGSQIIVYRVNCGGDLITANPMNWQADTYAAPSPYLTNPSTSSLVEGGCWWPDHLNTTGVPDCLFGTFRYDWGAPILYDFPVANGTYIVNLYFAQKKNTWPPDYQQAPGDHMFDIYLESQLLLNDFDMYAENGFDAIKKAFNVTITDGHINIELVNVVNSPQINGIEIISVSDASPSPGARLLSQESLEEGQDFYAKPNPVTSSSNKFTLVLAKALSEKVTVSILDEVGATIVLKNYLLNNEGTIDIDLSSTPLKRGIYLVKVNSKTIKNQTVKLLKE